MKVICKITETHVYLHARRTSVKTVNIAQPCQTKNTDTLY